MKFSMHTSSAGGARSAGAPRGARRTVAALLCIGLAGAGAGAAVAAEPDASSAAPAGSGLVSGRYNLGVQQFAQPLPGRFAQMPIALRGSVSVPEGSGPFPVVVLAHGAHGDNCPVVDDVDTWPCFDRERRSELGLAYLGRALAEQGFLTVAPSVNAAYTGGWGEPSPVEYRRFRDVVDSTLAALGAAGAGTQRFGGLDLSGRVDLERVGVLGHSRGGLNAVRYAATHAQVRSLFLLAPVLSGRRLPDIATTVAVGTCDGDTGISGSLYAVRASKVEGRRSPLTGLTVQGANHNYYNSVLVSRRTDDVTADKAGCGRGQRASAVQQQQWLRQAAGTHFSASLLEPATVSSYLRPSAPDVLNIAGLGTGVRRF